MQSKQLLISPITIAASSVRASFVSAMLLVSWTRFSLPAFIWPCIPANWLPTSSSNHSTPMMMAIRGSSSTRNASFVRCSSTGTWSRDSTPLHFWNSLCSLAPNFNCPMQLSPSWQENSMAAGLLNGAGVFSSGWQSSKFSPPWCPASALSNNVRNSTLTLNPRLKLSTISVLDSGCDQQVAPLWIGSELSTSTQTSLNYLAGTIQFSCGQTWRLIGTSGVQNELQGCWYHTPNGEQL